jgi:hypothetical protein
MSCIPLQQTCKATAARQIRLHDHRNVSLGNTAVIWEASDAMAEVRGDYKQMCDSDMEGSSLSGWTRCIVSSRADAEQLLPFHHLQVPKACTQHFEPLTCSTWKV